MREIGDVIADLLGGFFGGVQSTELTRRNLFPVLNRSSKSLQAS